MALEERSGIKVLSKLILEKLGEVDAQTTTNTVKLDGLAIALEELTTQVKLLLMHQSEITGEVFRDDEVNSY